MKRTLFFFNDGSEQLLELNMASHPVAALINRLLTTYYDGKKIKLVNFNMMSQRTYRLFPVVKKYHAKFGDGILQYNDIVDLEVYLKMGSHEKRLFLWKRGCEGLKNAARQIHDTKLLAAVDLIYAEGLRIDLVPDYRVVEADIELYGHTVHASVWILFEEVNMRAVLTLELNSIEIFKKEIDKTIIGWDQFLGIFKKIIAEKNTVVVKGPYDLPQFPIKVKIDESIFR